MDFIYSMSAQRGQGAPEILYFTDTYEKAIIYYYEFIKINSHSTQRGQKINDNEEYEVEFYQLSKYPLDCEFIEKGTSWSKVKMIKSSKYKIKFKNWGELKKEYLSCKRNEKLETILGE